MDIFIAQSSLAESSAGLAEVLSSGLGFESMEERESSNYAEGFYFIAKLNDGDIELSYLDTEGLGHWLFLLSTSDATSLSVSDIAHKISALGIKCFVPIGKWYLKSWGGDGVLHEP